jgi:microcin C transport system substrate-binding protein
MRKAIYLVAPKLWAFSCIAIWTVTLPVQAEKLHALALYGEPKYAADFQKFDYVSLNAKKGGAFNNAVVGSFDSLNPFIIRGLPASGLGLLYETLLENSLDEPQTGYGLLAESIEVPEDRSSVRFTLRDQARWHDGTKITSNDVVWSFQTLLKHGQPFYRSYYAQVSDVKAIDARTIEFTFKKAGMRELPLVIGSMPVLPKAYWTAKGRDFSKTTLEIPLGSGPYKIKSVESGRRIVYERNKDWWAADLPIYRGRFNFDTITYDYYRDPSVAFQAFLAGNADFRQENIAKNWAQGYNHPAVKSGKVVKQEIEHELPAGMQAFAYNLRRPIFQDARVREALAYAFDYEWSNKQLAFGSYTRTNSYFANSPLAADKPITMEELALLEPYRDQLPSRLFSEIYQPPKTDGSGNARTNLRQAQKLLAEAGWTLQGNLLKNAKGEVFKFEILTDSPMFDRWILPFIANLKRLGITANLRAIDTAQMQNRLTDFDFDMTITSIGQSLTPGNEQHAYWSSEMADQPGSSNLMGIKNPVVDALVDKIISASTYEELQTATRALDRVLLWNFYVIPQWYVGTFRVAYWDKFGRPSINPPYGLPVADTWWIK